MPNSVLPGGIRAAGLGITVATPPLVLAAGTTKTIFTVYGGPIHVNAIWGVVTTVIQTQACNLKLSVQVGSLTAVDICANGAVSALAVGTVLAPITAFATALSVAGTNGVLINMPGASGSFTQFEICQTSGSTNTATVYMTTSATNTGAIQWYMNYVPYQNNTPVVATQANYPVTDVKAAVS